ncbi:MAG: leucyl/phenylalanyl-tRNA--protein transferase [Candidatus Dadabacteria bacterium]|nr:MAG: leucyl/phenylalanyl-tRNA--protein transferase [Candidatus Dadabacteria bacterium]
MVIKSFPPHELADEYGLLAVGGDCEVDSLLLAYRNGIFPWPVYDDILTWFSPPKRAVLFFKDLHIPRSLKKLRKKNLFTFAIDRNFNEVINQCATSPNRGDQSGTWITKQIIEGYIELHKAGYAHSIECYSEDKLVGGLYGVSIGAMFAGESMFYTEPNASKLALLYLIDYLRNQQVDWIDCQVMTPLLKQFGAIEIPRAEFLTLLNDAIARNVQPFNFIE